MEINEILDLLSRSAGNEYVLLDDKIVKYIEREISRTGLTPYQYCRRKNKSTQLNEGKISRWRCHEAKTAKKTDLQEFVSAWANEPDGDERIDLTEKAVAALLNEKTRTGVGSVALLLNAANVPKDLTANLVQTWITKRTVTARRDHYDFVKNAWEALPDTKTVVITSEIRRELKDEAQRTGKGAAALMRGIRPSEIGGLSSNIIKSWLSGTVKSSTSEQIAFVMTRWRSLPEKDRAKENAKPKKMPNTKRVLLTEAMQSILRGERERTGISEKSLVAIKASEGKSLPAFRTINRWINGNVKAVDKDEYAAVLSAWKERPSRKP